MHPASKVTPEHLQRGAYLYLRQSTWRPGLDHPGSAQRQYALRQRALALGWPEDRIIVIDQDQGQSAGSAVDRQGFQRLMTEVGRGQAGLVLAWEASRLARHSAAWHRFVDLCALTQALILDEDGLYDPAHDPDRLLLAGKGGLCSPFHH